jgi:histone acetyltransferase (RNA polymerase elongator complex component)
MWKKGEYEEHTVEDAVCLCSRIIPMFLESRIPVIRLGLNPSDDLSGGTAAGGAYHPSFGELVYSRIMRNRAEQILQSRKMSGLVELHVSPSFVSKMTGNRKSNLDYLSRLFPDVEFRVIPDDSVPDWDVAVPLQKD